MDTKKTTPGKRDKRSGHNVREGQEDSSILKDNRPPDNTTYPRLPEQDKQAHHQPEFIDSESNLKKADNE